MNYFEDPVRFASGRLVCLITRKAGEFYRMDREGDDESAGTIPFDFMTARRMIVPSTNQTRLWRFLQ
jgi:hypothetical protein